MRRMNLVVGEQVNFWIVEQDKRQFAAGDTQRHLPGKLRRQALQIARAFGSGDVAAAIGIHYLAFTSGPLFEECQVHRHVNVLRTYRQLNPVLDKLAEEVVTPCGARHPKPDARA